MADTANNTEVSERLPTTNRTGERSEAGNEDIAAVEAIEEAGVSAPNPITPALQTQRTLVEKVKKTGAINESKRWPFLKDVRIASPAERVLLAQNKLIAEELHEIKLMLAAQVSGSMHCSKRTSLASSTPSTTAAYDPLDAGDKPSSEDIQAIDAFL